MTCAQCRDRVGMDWIEWRQRHVVNLGDQGHQLVTVHAAVLCPPPRICAMEYAMERNADAGATILHHAGDEPF